MRNNQSGQVIVEALVALGAAVVIVGVIATVVVTSLNNSELAKNQNLATQYAQQGMETVREMSETNWSSFSSYTGWYCLQSGSDSLTSDNELPAQEKNSCKWPNSIFSRRVDVEWGTSAPDCNANNNGNAKVTVTVAWGDSKCKDTNDLYCHKVQVDSCFANIRSVPAI